MQGAVHAARSLAADGPRGARAGHGPSPARCSLPGPPPPDRRWPRGPSPRTRPSAPHGLETGSKERANEQGGGRGWEEQPATLGAGRASAGEAARRQAGERSFFPLPSRPGPRAAANHPLSNSSAESRDPRSLSRACAPLIAGEAASGALEWYALGPGRRRRRRTGFQGPLPRRRPPTCPRPRPPPSCAQWVHSFLLERSTNIYQVPTGCPAPGRAPRGCGGKNPCRPPFPALAVGTGKVT